MSDCQKAGARASVTGRAYSMVAPVFDSLPQRFEIRDVMRAGKIPESMIGAVKHSLIYVFKCIKVGSGSTTWKKS